MLVANVMTSPVVTIEPSASIGEAARLMLAHHISGLPVATSDGTLVGVVTEGDFLRRRELDTQRKRSGWLEFLASPGKTADEYVHSHGRKVEEVMPESVVTTTPDASLEDVVAMMIKHHIKRLPVVVDGKIVGIISRSDLLRVLVDALPAEDATPGDDAQIKAAIAAELGKQTWSRNGFIRADVKDGAVQLNGTIFDERERLAAIVAVENIPGVKSVKDQLTWVDPLYGVAITPPDAPSEEKATK